VEGQNRRPCASVGESACTGAGIAGAAGLPIHVADGEAVAAVAALLARVEAEAKGRARGPVTICVADRESGVEVDVSTGRDYPASPQIKGAIKSVSGVVLVEEI